MSSPVNLLNLKPEEFQKFLDSFDYVYSDCDGVIWQMTPYPRVGEFFALMEKHGKTVHFASNNSVRTRESYEEKFKSADIENGFERLTVPSSAIAEYLKGINFSKQIYSVASKATRNIFDSYGIKCKYGPDFAPDNYLDFIPYSKDDPKIGAVVFDGDIQANLAKLHKSCTYLRRPDVLFLSGMSDKAIHLQKGHAVLGCQFFTDAVAGMVKRDPLEFAKPSKLYGELLMKRTGATDPSRVLFIGDTIDQDVQMGKNAGFQTLMVLTFTPEEKMLSHPTTRPDYYAESLASIVPLL